MFYKIDETRNYICETVTQLSVTKKMSPTKKLSFENTTV